MILEHAAITTFATEDNITTLNWRGCEMVFYKTDHRCFVLQYTSTHLYTFHSYLRSVAFLSWGISSMSLFTLCVEYPRVCNTVRGWVGGGTIHHPHASKNQVSISQYWRCRRDFHSQIAREGPYDALCLTFCVLIYCLLGKWHIQQGECPCACRGLIQSLWHFTKYRWQL